MELSKDSKPKPTTKTLRLKLQIVAFQTMVQDFKCILASIPAKLYITDIYNDSVSPTME